MKQAKPPSAKELEQGYEIVPMSKPTCQPSQNARLTGEMIDLENDKPVREAYED